MLNWMLESGRRAAPARKCTHSLVRKGYYLGLETEEWVCLGCGMRAKTRERPHPTEESAQRVNP
jgi:hypothetical protein